MEATPERGRITLVADVLAGVVTIACFLGSLSMAYQMCHASNSSGIPFFPLGAAIICVNAWMLYGLAAGDSIVVRVNACSLTLMAVLSPILRILQKIPLPEIAAWTLATCGVWALYGILAWEVWLFLANFIGVVVAAAELILAVWMLWGSGDDAVA
ncbi:uncharacterized protein LOC119405428 [Rhipicephalus sanguineus]|uniref:uncharacterized protein LOC119405428 n=1 Tax=Rhipicephalus sanguineus TaxID=34632 RepID=UPI0018932693|nr:uncharacterized protein LOC119405428 [Rhipicephalus sanguineus]